MIAEQMASSGTAAIMVGYSRGYRDSGREYLQKMLQHAEPREREIIEKMMHKL